MKKKVLKALALILAIILIIGVGLFANALVGNPVSKFLATKGAQEHLAKNYGDKDFVVEEVNYDFKTGGYYARVTSPTSIDSHFSLSFDWLGKLVRDCYDDDVTSGWNTRRRINDEYKEIVDKVFANNQFPGFLDISDGLIQFTSDENVEDPSIPEYAIITETLKIDAVYDIKELGAKAGKLTVYIDDKTVTEEKLAEILLTIKTNFDNSGVTFYAIDCVLEEPKTEMEADGTPKESPRVEVMDFLYSDIYEDGLVERVREANQKAIEYNEEQDKIKEAEISEALSQ